jgi:hypothetical protein
MRCVGHGACMGKMINTYKTLVGKFEGKILHGRPTCKWENNIRMNLREMGKGGLDLFGSV